MAEKEGFELPKSALFSGKSKKTIANNGKKFKAFHPVNSPILRFSDKIRKGEKNLERVKEREKTSLRTGRSED